MKMNIELLKGSLLTGIINAFINGAINWFSVRKLAEIPLMNDLISTKTDTVFSGVVLLATSLAFIFTTILVQRMMGTVMISPIESAPLSGVFAGMGGEVGWLLNHYLFLF